MIPRPRHYCKAIPVILLLILTVSCVERRSARPDRDKPTVSIQLAEMVREDQRLRADTTLEWSFIKEADQRHREEVFRLLVAGDITAAADQLDAAKLLQHADPSTCSECYLLAYQLSMAAVEQGLDDARYIAALNLDRYLVFSGNPQKYGTQYNTDSTGYYYLFPVDSLTTDSMRSEWNVEPLDSIRARLARWNEE